MIHATCFCSEHHTGINSFGSTNVMCVCVHLLVMNMIEKVCMHVFTGLAVYDARRVWGFCDLRGFSILDVRHPTLPSSSPSHQLGAERKATGLPFYVGESIQLGPFIG